MANKDDPQHQAAVVAWEKLIDDQELIITSNYVVVETTALLQNRHGLAAVRKLYETILPVCIVEWVDSSIHEAAASILLGSSGRRSPSLVDCVGFQIIRRNKISAAFVFDRHFEDRGFEVVGP
jgi:uncharacterized protein